jgi:hypothetical protein
MIREGGRLPEFVLSVIYSLQSLDCPISSMPFLEWLVIEYDRFGDSVNIMYNT